MAAHMHSVEAIDSENGRGHCLVQILILTRGNYKPGQITQPLCTAVSLSIK